MKKKIQRRPFSTYYACLSGAADGSGLWFRPPPKEKKTKKRRKADA